MFLEAWPEESAVDNGRLVILVISEFDTIPRAIFFASAPVLVMSITVVNAQREGASNDVAKLIATSDVLGQSSTLDRKSLQLLLNSHLSARQ